MSGHSCRRMSTSDHQAYQDGRLDEERKRDQRNGRWVLSFFRICLFDRLQDFSTLQELSIITSKMPGPTIVIVPGFWLGPKPYELLVDELKRAAPSLTDIAYAELASTGTRSPNAPTMLDDAMGIRAVIKPLVEAGKRVIVVGHSAGAFLSAMATEDLEVGQKIAKASGGGGVEKFVFVAGGLLPVGARHPPTDWEVKVQFLSLNIRSFNIDITQDGATLLPDADVKLFSDVDASIAEKYCKPFIKSQPLMSEWGVECTYTGWDKVPSTYVLTENDQTISPEVQAMCAGLAGSEVVRMQTGHMPMLADPKGLAERIVECIGLKE